MKRIYSKIALVIAVCIVLMSCSNTHTFNMSIQPSTFSQETTDILKLFDDEIQFYDIFLDESAKYRKISVWLYGNDGWYKAGETSGEVEYLDNRIAIRLTKEVYELYVIDENGHTKYSLPITEANFENLDEQMDWRLSQKTPIELNKELVLWAKIATDNNDALGTDEMIKDFKNIECSGGVVITITILDEPTQ